MRYACLLVAVFGLGVDAGCTSRDTSDPVVDVKADDPVMNAAIDKARATVDKFITALNDPKPQQNFSVKMAVEDENGVEHMWLAPVEIKGTKFVGTLNNEPGIVRSVEYGDTLTVDKTEISDWMIVQDQTISGGYTMRVLIDQMPEEEKSQILSTMEFAD